MWSKLKLTGQERLLTAALPLVLLQACVPRKCRATLGETSVERSHGQIRVQALMIARSAPPWTSTCDGERKRFCDRSQSSMPAARIDPWNQR